MTHNMVNNFDPLAADIVYQFEILLQISTTFTCSQRYCTAVK